jgi:hypothetical protein
MLRREIPFEQAVYGSFPFWDRGYGLLARSAGCRPEWIEGFQAACRRYGERPTGIADAEGLFVLRLVRGPWLIVGVIPIGQDDSGRPGALAFHGLFVHPRDYRRVRFDPFCFEPVIQRTWTAADQHTILPTGRVAPASPGFLGRIRSLCRWKSEIETSRYDESASLILEAMSRRDRVVVPTDRPIPELARRTWSRMPRRIRRRSSMATWAFDNSNGFDFVALPRCRAAGLAPANDPSSLVLPSPDEPDRSARCVDQMVTP